LGGDGSCDKRDSEERFEEHLERTVFFALGIAGLSVILTRDSD